MIRLCSVLVRQEAELLAVLEHLLHEIVRVFHLHIGDLTLGIQHGQQAGLDETSVRRRGDLLSALLHLGVQGGIHFLPIGLHQGLACLVVPLALDALHFAEQFTEQHA